MLIQKNVKFVLFILLLTWLTFSSNPPFKKEIQVKASVCANDGDSCITEQFCPGICSSSACTDIVDNCPNQPPPPPPAGESTIKNPVLGPGLQGVSGISLLQKFIPIAIQWGFIIGIVIFFFMFIIGGIKWIASSGDKQKLEGARGTITSALIGIVILFAVFAIIQLIGKFFGITLLEVTLPTL